MFDRETIEATRALERPSVRCRIDAVYIDEDGQREHGTKETTGRIVVDGNNPWVELWAAGAWHAERFSWGLVLEVLNDRFAPPIHFAETFEYER